MIKLPIYKLMCCHITFGCLDLWCSHPGWLLYTDTVDMSGDVPASICEFTKLRLCRDRGVVALSRPEMHECNCPSSAVPISASQGQHCLQKIGGITFFGKLREAVWMSPHYGGTWVNMLGYDGSLAKSVLIDSVKAHLGQPREMVATTVPTRGADDRDEVRKGITKWIQQTTKQEIVNCPMSLMRHDAAQGDNANSRQLLGHQADVPRGVGEESHQEAQVVEGTDPAAQ